MSRRFERSWKSKIFVCAVVAVLVTVVFAVPSFSHNPADVALNYDQGKQTLFVTVTHSPFSDIHYVKEVEVGKNGKSVGIYPYNAQPGEKFTNNYKIPAQPGDVLEAKSTCVKYGSKAGRMTVERLQ
ncbi:MAG: hypothetical protein NTV99_08470 [Deltaproteobacteria bacterium]|nr:hypothetical protein [Deltaproteobacteria bacterium]